MKATRILASLIALGFLICGFAASAATPFTVVPTVSTNLVGDEVRLLILQDDLPANPANIYHWFFNGIPLVDNEQITGSQVRELIVANVALTNGGLYTATVATNGVQVATLSATVHVIAEPEILTVTSETIGVDVTFRAVATGGLLAYQWFWQGREITGATNSSLRFTNAYNIANAGFYSVRVTNLLGSAFSSSNALLFTKPTPTGTYQGIYFIDGAPTAETGGSFQFTISGSRRSFSGKLISGTNVVRTSGAFSVDHVADVLLPAVDGVPVPVRLQLITTNDNAQMIGLSTNAATEISLLGNRLYYTSKITNALGGKYTLVLQNTNVSPLAPNGHGFATLKISSSGKVNLTGVSADGIRFFQTSGLSRLGDFPLYASLNQSRGRLLGILRVAKQTTNSIRGQGIVWIKDPGPDALYPNGFDLTLEGVGSTYLPPIDKQPVIAWTNGVAGFGHFFADGAVLWEFVQVVLRPPISFRPESSTQKLQLSVSKSSGIISGKFTDPVTGLRNPIKGVILQQQKNARGFFITTNSVGAFTMDRK